MRGPAFDVAATIKAFRAEGGIRPTARALGIGKTTCAQRLARCVNLGALPLEEVDHLPSVVGYLDRSTGYVQSDSGADTPSMAVQEAPAHADIERARVAAVAAQERARRAEAALRRQDLEALERDAILEMIGGLASRPSGAPAWVVEREAASPGQSIPVLLLSDWHLGEVVNPREVHGYNAFDIEVARARIRETIERTIHLSRNYNGQQTYPGIVVPVLGDMVSGSLHPELEATDDLSIFESIPVAVDLLEWSIRTLADEFGNVYVPAACGNHGRVLDKKPRAKGYAARNADFLIYTLLAKRFQSDSRVKIEFNDANEVLFEIFGLRFLAAHGDHLGSKGGDGQIGALGPVMRGALKTSKHGRSLGREHDWLLIGHWHTPLWLPGVIVNGCLKGYDEYASRFLKAPAGPAEQSLFFVHPRRGITGRFEILLGERETKDVPHAVPPSWMKGGAK